MAHCLIGDLELDGVAFEAGPLGPNTLLGHRWQHLGASKR
jgi:hypothetical protein